MPQSQFAGPILQSPTIPRAKVVVGVTHTLTSAFEPNLHYSITDQNQVKVQTLQLSMPTAMNTIYRFHKYDKNKV